MKLPENMQLRRQLAKRCAYQISSEILVFVMLVLKFNFQVLFQKSTRGLERIIYRGVLMNILLHFVFIITFYLHSVQVHSVNWLKDVDEWLGEGRSLALFYS
jgi:hypothetical protein